MYVLLHALSIMCVSTAVLCIAKCVSCAEVCSSGIILYCAPHSCPVLYLCTVQQYTYYANQIPKFSCMSAYQISSSQYLSTVEILEVDNQC